MEKIYIGIVLGFVLLASSCTKNSFISTGNSQGRFDGTMLEYMEAHSYDWDSTVVMIHHAGEEMVALFDGRDENHPEITFWGFTNHSIRRYLLENDIEQVSDLDPEWCKSILLQHVVDKKYFRTDLPKGILGEYDTQGIGGITLKTLAGTDVCAYTVVKESGGITENAARPIYMIFKKSGRHFGIASGDLEQDNGVVHALEYWFTIGQEEK